MHKLVLYRHSPIVWLTHVIHSAVLANRSTAVLYFTNALLYGNKSTPFRLMSPMQITLKYKYYREFSRSQT